MLGLRKKQLWPPQHKFAHNDSKKQSEKFYASGFSLTATIILRGAIELFKFQTEIGPRASATITIEEAHLFIKVIETTLEFGNVTQVQVTLF